MKGSQRTKGIEAQLRQAIREAPISRNQLSIESGVDPAQLCYFAQGKRTLTLRSAERIAEVLGLELVQTRKRKSKKNAPASTTKGAKDAGAW